MYNSLEMKDMTITTAQHLAELFHEGQTRADKVDCFAFSRQIQSAVEGSRFSRNGIDTNTVRTGDPEGTFVWHYHVNPPFLFEYQAGKESARRELWPRHFPPDHDMPRKSA